VEARDITEDWNAEAHLPRLVGRGYLPRNMMRALGVDHGEKRIGIAISDETGTIARPLTIIRHVSKQSDADRVLEEALRNGAGLIVIGQSTNEAGMPNMAGLRAMRFADLLKDMSAIPVLLWDESLTTQDARNLRMAAGARRKKRASPVDSLAAAVMLQSYLDSRPGRDDSSPLA
jgi:putative Holliday junction resolvase